MRRLVRPFTLHNRGCLPKPEPSKGFGSLQVLQMVAPRDLSWKPTAYESETVRIFDEFTGKMVQSVWSVILDSDQRFCPTLVQAGKNVTLEDYENALHQVRRHNSCSLVL